MSEDDVAEDRISWDPGVGVDVADRFDVDVAGDVLDLLGDGDEAHRPRQLITDRQQRLAEYAIQPAVCGTDSASSRSRSTLPAMPAQVQRSRCSVILRACLFAHWRI